MEITNKIGQRALTYVAAVAGQGYELTFAEFEAYVSMPMPASGLSLPWAGGATPPGSDLDGTAGDAEPVLDWLVRLGWLERGEATVRISPLGKAVLRAVTHQQRDVELPTEVSLGPDAPFDYARVLPRIAEQRDALLVDRFLVADQLMDILNRTSITRVLVGADRQHEAERRNLAAALSRAVGLDRPFYVGVSGELRDRYVIPPSGPVSFLATTVSRGGERLALLGAIDPPVADAVRRNFEDVWSRATPLGADGGQPLTELGVDGPIGALGAPVPADLMRDVPGRNGDVPVRNGARGKHEDRDVQLPPEAWPPKSRRGGRDDGLSSQDRPWTIDEPHGN